MRLVARVLISGLAISVLGAADARAPNLVESATSLSEAAPTREPLMSSRLADVPAARFANDPASASARMPEDSSKDVWLLSGVCIGLVGYQLRRKHRLLRPHPLPLNSESLG